MYFKRVSDFRSANVYARLFIKTEWDDNEFVVAPTTNTTTNVLVVCTHRKQSRLDDFVPFSPETGSHSELSCMKNTSVFKAYVFFQCLVNNTVMKRTHIH